MVIKLAEILGVETDEEGFYVLGNEGIMALSKFVASFPHLDKIISAVSNNIDPTKQSEEIKKVDYIM